MKAACIRAVSEALGRDLNAAEARGIEDRVRDGMRQAAVRDLEGFRAKSTQERLYEGAKIAAENIKAEAARAKMQTQMAVMVHDRNGGQIERAVGGGMDPQEAVQRMLFDRSDNRGDFMSLEGRIRATQEDYKRQLMHTMEALDPRLFGLLPNVEGSRAFIRELFGEASGNELIAKAAREWEKISEGMAEHYRAVGGAINRLQDWRFPQLHDQTRVFEAGQEAWVNDVLPKLDRNRYVSDAGRLMTDEEMRGFLSDVWDTIATNGANKIEPGIRTGSRMLANRELNHRVLHFDDADGYLAYQQKYGGRDLWSTLAGHVDGLSRSIAALEHFGPNADHEFTYWNDWAMREARHKKQNVQSMADKLDTGYRFLSGYTNGVSNARTARVADTLMNIQTAAKLGSAVISSLPDAATLTMTAAYNRVSVLHAYANVLRAMRPGNAEERAYLERAGLMVNAGMQAARRFQVSDLGPSFTARMASVVLRASGMNYWTEGLRSGYAAAHAHALGEIVAKHPTIGGRMHPDDVRMLRAKGVTDADYQVWREAELERTSFGNLLTAEAIYRSTDSPLEFKRDAARALLNLTLTEGQMAVVEPGAVDRIMMGGAAPKGELKGVLQRAFWQFKSFPWAFVRKHFIERGFGAHDTAGGKLGYIAPLTVLTTLLGALAVEINDMLSGRDPRPLYGADGKVVLKNWIAAFLKGGAMGVYGDFLGAAATDDPKSALATLAGPVPGMFAEAANVTLGNAVQSLGNKPTHVGQELVRFGKGNMPAANLWYTKAATDHYLFTWLQDKLNPGYAARSVARARQQYGSGTYWSTPGAPPQRGPNPGNIGGR